MSDATHEAWRTLAELDDCWIRISPSDDPDEAITLLPTGAILFGPAYDADRCATALWKALMQSGFVPDDGEALTLTNGPVSTELYQDGRIATHGYELAGEEERFLRTVIAYWPERSGAVWLLRNPDLKLASTG